MTQAELPGQQFHGTITHISGAIDVPTRSLQVEVTLPNPDDTLRPGAYVQVALPAAAHARLLGAGQRAAVSLGRPASRRGRCERQRCICARSYIAQDLGQSLEIESGIEASDKIIINPSDSIADGDHVLIAAPQSKGKKTS